MRETLHQLTLTLALPIAVGAVWMARAERAEPPARERATAYRVELDDLPLPIRERLRTPGFATPVPASPGVPEEAEPLRERPLFERPSRPEPVPVDLAGRAGATRVFGAAPSPRAVRQPLDAPTPTPAPRPALRAAAPIALTAPSLSSRRAAASSTLPSATPGAIATPQPSADAPAADADPLASKRERIFARQDLPSPVHGGPVRDGFQTRGKPISIPRAPGRIDPGKHVRDPIPGRTPLLPSTPIARANDRAEDFSLPITELPRFEPHEVAKPEPSFDFEPEIEARTPVQSSSHRPIFRFLPIPEPGSAILFGASLAALGALRRRWHPV
jgi:hypothetical protein